MAAPHNWAAGEASLPPRPASPSSSSAWVIDTAPTPSRGGEKAKRQRRHHSSSPELEQEPSFTFDVQGDEQPDEPSEEQGNAQPSKPSSSSLLLPEHVAVAPQSAADAPTDSPLDDPQDDDPGSLGDFTQLDGDATASRYYDVEAASARKALKECEICGERGHTKRDCDHLLCASCGATDEHTTRECPVGVACFRCGQKGHRRNECTADLRRMPRRTRECGRCGSYNHQMEACPTLWRIYAYVGEDEWEAFRRRKRARSSSSDGEDEGSWDPAQRWCYNCAARGTHWGDDCPMPRRSRHGEPSIFSELVSTMGPFGSRLAPPPPTAPRADGYTRNDMYDVSVGPNTSMHFLGGAGRAGGSSSNASLEEEVDRMFARAPGASKRRAEKERGRRAAMAQESAAGSSSSTPATRTSKAAKKDKQKGNSSKANGKAGNSSGPQQGSAAMGMGTLPLPRAATGLEARMDDYIVISSDDDDDDANTSRASAKKRKRGETAVTAPPKDKNSKKKKARLSNEGANANANANGKGKSKADKKAKKGGDQPTPPAPPALPPRGALGGKFAKERRLRALDAQQQANGGGGGGGSSNGSHDEPLAPAPAPAPAKKKNKKQREKEKKAKAPQAAPPPPPPAAPSAKKKSGAPNGHTAATNGAAGARRGRPARGRGKGPMFRGGYD